MAEWIPQNPTEFARKIIEGTGGMDAYERHELAVFHVPDRVAAAEWTLRCLANPDCEGSASILDAILSERQRKRDEAAAKSA